MGELAIQIPESIVDRIVQETNPFSYQSATEELYFLSVVFDSNRKNTEYTTPVLDEKVRRLGEKITQETGFGLEKYSSTCHDTLAGSWLFNLGKGEQEINIKVMKLLNKLRGMGIKVAYRELYEPPKERKIIDELRSRVREDVQDRIIRTIDSSRQRFLGYRQMVKNDFY